MLSVSCCLNLSEHATWTWQGSPSNICPRRMPAISESGRVEGKGYSCSLMPNTSFLFLPGDWLNTSDSGESLCFVFCLHLLGCSHFHYQSLCLDYRGFVLISPAGLASSSQPQAFIAQALVSLPDLGWDQTPFVSVLSTPGTLLQARSSTAHCHHTLYPSFIKCKAFWNL